MIERPVISFRLYNILTSIPMVVVMVVVVVVVVVAVCVCVCVYLFNVERRIFPRNDPGPGSGHTTSRSRLPVSN